ncbi:hypothetical protein A2U01_0061876, partial [Trifolium medium]|nr:hypothetical protein [Trifolium medium]
SSKKCKLGVPEAQEVMNVQTGVTSPLSSSSAPLSVDHLLAHFSQLSVTQSKEREAEKKVLRKKVKKLERSNGELEARVSSFEKDIKEHGQPVVLHASLRQ